MFCGHRRRTRPRQDIHLDVVLGDSMRETLGLAARRLRIAALQRLPHVLATCTPQRLAASGAPMPPCTTLVGSSLQGELQTPSTLVYPIWD